MFGRRGSFISSYTPLASSGEGFSSDDQEVVGSVPRARSRMLKQHDEDAVQPRFIDFGKFLAGSDPVMLGDEEALALESIRGLEARRAELLQKLADLEALLVARSAPFRTELQDVERQLETQQDELTTRLQEKADAESRTSPPGPTVLKFVDSAAFSIVCSVVIFANLVCMICSLQIESTDKHSKVLHVLDQVFLVWYCLELMLKSVFHQRGFLIGKRAVVWWNWLDLSIVISGIIDQWLTPLLGFEAGPGGLNTRALRTLRFLRLFRVARALKIIRSFLVSDLSWTEGHQFESFIMTMIIVNALIMGLELDYSHWGGWFWIEHMLLLVYFFELAARLKLWGWEFFYHQSNWFWHWIDFAIVCMAMAEQWMLPTVRLVQVLVVGEATDVHGTTMHTLLSVLRLFRLLRILRLIHIFRGIRPLFRLAQGVKEALHGMQWVMVLTVILLYVGSIMFTNLVGHGIIYGDEATPKRALAKFGTTARSMFSLFKLMNDDQSVVDSVVTSMAGKLLFALFMVASNWMILAVLTSVISDHMISASQRELEQDNRTHLKISQADKVKRLMLCFQEYDHDEKGVISRKDFQELLSDPGMCQEVCAAADLSLHDLKDLYYCLSDNHQCIHYHDFVQEVHSQGENADKHSIYRVIACMRDMEARIEKRQMMMLSMLAEEREEHKEQVDLLMENGCMTQQRTMAASSHAFSFMFDETNSDDLASMALMRMRSSQKLDEKPAGTC